MTGTYACLTDAQWNLIKDVLPTEGSSKGGRPAGKVRPFIDSLLWIAKTGAPWRALQDTGFGKWSTIYSRMRRWATNGFLSVVWNAFEGSGLIDKSTQMADGTFNRALKAAAGANKKTSGGQTEQGLGRCKGGFATKIHVIVDAKGLPISYKIDGGQVNDIINAYEFAYSIYNCDFLGDKAYDSNKLINQLKKQGCNVIIPPKKNRKEPRDYDQEKYKDRHFIENFFARIKEFRRIAVRSDKLKHIYGFFFELISIVIFCRNALKAGFKQLLRPEGTVES